MRTRNYIACLTALLAATACSNQENFLSDYTETGNEVQFTATLQQTATITPRTLGNNSGETEVLPYVYDIRIRKIDTQNMENLHIETQIFNVRTGNYGTLDMEPNADKTAMKWTDKTHPVDFFAWTAPTGVSIEDDASSGTVNFGCSDKEGNKPTTDIEHDTFNGKDGTPLEIFISAHKEASFDSSPSVNLGFKHVVSKVSINVRWWTNEDITSQVTITFPFINKIWQVAQIETNGSQKAFAVTEQSVTESLSLELKQLKASNNNYRTFYLPPLTGENYKLEKTGDFEIKYKNDVYYGSLASIITSSRTTLEAGEYLTLNIQLNPNFNAGGNANIKTWAPASQDIAYANPYRGIYTVEGLKVLKKYLGSTEVNKELPDSLHIKNGEKKIIRLYNDLDLSSLEDGDLSLLLEKNITFDGLGHIVTVPSGKSLFGDISATDVKINNVRLSGAGTLANTLTKVEVFNCHANGTGNLVGTAKDGTSFDFCSAEGANNLLAGTTSGTVTMQNCFVAYDGATKLAGTGGTVTAKNSFIFNTVAETVTGTYYDESGSSQENNITVDAQQLVVTTSTTRETGKKEKLIDLLNKASNTSNNNETYWVYVYRKTYPVMRIKYAQ